MTAKLQAKTKEVLVGELVETQRRLGELEETDKHNQRAMASLLESAKLFRTIADSAVDAFISGNKDGKITYWNKAAAEIFGYSENEIIGQPVARLVPGQYREAHKKGLHRVVETGKTKIVGKSVELTGLRKDNTEFPLELSLSMAPTREGPVFTVVARDISRRKQLEETLKKSEERYRNTIDNMLEGCQIIGFDWRYLYLNDVAATHGHRTKAELLGHTMMELYPGIENTEMFAALQRCMEERIPGSMENEFTYPDGATGWFELSIQPTTEGIFVLSQEITERKQAETELQRVNEFLEKVFDSLKSAIFVIDNDRRFINCNAAAARIFGYKKEELIGKSTELLWPDRRAYEEIGGSLRNEILKRGYFEGEIDLRRKDGSIFPSQFAASKFIGPGEEPAGIVVAIDDIAELKTMQAEKEKISRQNERLLNSTGEGIYGLDLGGKVTFVNPAAAAICGYKVEEIIGKSAHKTWHHSRSDGSHYPVTECPIYAAYKDGEVHRRDDEVFWRKDGSSFPVEYVSTPIKENEKLLGAVVIFNDITQQKQAVEEMGRLNRALQALSKANEALIRADDEKKLLEEVCKIIIDVGGYMFAWAGYVAFDKGMEIRPAVYAGQNHGFIEKLPVIWHNTKNREGPMRRALRRGVPAVISNIDSDRRFIPWKEEALECGFAAMAAYPLKVADAVTGVLCIYSAVPGAFDDKESELLTELADDLSFGIAGLRTRQERERAERDLEKSLERIKKVTAGMTQALATAAEVRDPYTAGHQQRVTDLAVAIAREMGLTDDQIDFIRTGGTLHDVGKISVPAEILTNPGKLTALELDLVREHAQYSYEILKEAEFPWPVAELVAQHHERLDGSGYPKGLKGDEIMQEAKILAVADVVEAMSSHRPYRPSLGVEAAIEEISRKQGVLYDENVVDACLGLLKEKKFSFKSAA